MVGISFFFSFVSFVAPVVLVEGLAGRAALKRSFALVWSDWLRVLLTIVTFGIGTRSRTRWLP